MTEVIDAVLVTTDVMNAFNSVERKNVMDAVEWALQGSESAVEILELVRYGLQPGTIVLSDGSQRTMDRGVVQGDPTSATLFGTWMAYVLYRVKESHPDTMAFLRPGGASAAELLRRGKTVIWAYADDVAFLGRNEADVWAAHATFRDLLAAGGQQLCDAKTEVVASRMVTGCFCTADKRSEEGGASTGCAYRSGDGCHRRPAADKAGKGSRSS